MPIIGVNFDKIEAERLKKSEAKIDIKNNLGIKDLEVEKFPVESMGEVLKFYFEFSLEYEPGIGKVLINGHVLYTEEPKKLKDIQKEWKKDKKINVKLLEQLLNVIIQRCHIKAVMLEQEVNLPFHIALPILQAPNKDKEYIG